MHNRVSKRGAGDPASLLPFIDTTFRSVCLLAALPKNGCTTNAVDRPQNPTEKSGHRFSR
jgi:hypothetical protein